jgi:transcription elongation factor Elf1
MSLNEPEDMSNLVYFTNRKLGDGKIMAWAERPDCPECQEAQLSKPEKKTGPGPNTRAKKYTCNNCDFEMHEDDLREVCTLKATYTCPHCGEEGESTGEYERTKYQGTKAYVLECEHCDGRLPLTKKMKDFDELKP